MINQAALLARFHERYPAVSLLYTTGVSASLTEQVQSGRIDAAFIVVPDRTPSDLEVRPLTTFEQMVVCRPDHPLAGVDRVDVDMLKDETFIGMPRSVVHGAISRLVRTTDNRSRPALEVSDVGSILEFVAHGLGIAVLSHDDAMTRPPLVAIPFSDPSMVWTVGLITTTAKRRSPPASAFLELLDTDGAA
jgi:DNA-binding transcriptional LysR family regulator